MDDPQTSSGGSAYIAVHGSDLLLAVRAGYEYKFVGYFAMNTRAICLFIHSPSSYVRLFRARSISIYLSLSHPSQISNGSLDHTYNLPLPSRLRENQRESDLSGLKQIAGCVKVKGRGYLQEIGTRMPIRPRQSRQMHEVEKLDRRM
jgi:hypothetical protein